MHEKKYPTQYAELARDTRYGPLPQAKSKSLTIELGCVESYS